ncbi:MAG: ribonuclease HII [Verrucomicrobiales bacterium]
MPCHLEFEIELRAKGARTVAGVDETGRGCLAGPVYAAAVILPDQFSHATLNDSKQLTPEEREEIYAELRGDGRILISCCWASVEEIERLNILRASHLAMKRALRGLPCRPEGILIDGLPIKRFGYRHRSIIDGDAISFSIAAASVVAKVERDRHMLELAKKFPRYGFERNKGYGTPGHKRALRRHGPCSLHRMTFGPVTELLMNLRKFVRRRTRALTQQALRNGGPAVASPASLVPAS